MIVGNAGQNPVHRRLQHAHQQQNAYIAVVHQETPWATIIQEAAAQKPVPDVAHKLLLTIIRQRLVRNRKLVPHVVQRVVQH